jgi:hypothetical protein
MFHFCTAKVYCDNNEIVQCRSQLRTSDGLLHYRENVSSKEETIRTKWREEKAGCAPGTSEDGIMGTDSRGGRSIRLPAMKEVERFFSLFFFVSNQAPD